MTVTVNVEGGSGVCVGWPAAGVVGLFDGWAAAVVGMARMLDTMSRRTEAAERPWRTELEPGDRDHTPLLTAPPRPPYGYARIDRLVHSIFHRRCPQPDRLQSREMSSATPPLSDSFPLTAARRDAPEIVLAHRETLRLFDECGPRLRRYVRSCGVADGAADDVVQEVFLALFRHLCLGRPRDNLAAWLYQVAFRTAVRYRHRAQDRMAVEERWGPGLEDALRDTTGDPETARSIASADGAFNVS